jgi:hypothetical protein
MCTIQSVEQTQGTSERLLLLETPVLTSSLVVRWLEPVYRPGVTSQFK